MATTTGEKVYHDSGGTTVTSSRVVIGGTTYALRNITSVSMGEVRPDRMGELIVTSVGGVFALWGAGMAAGEANDYSNDASIWPGVALCVLGLVLLAAGILRLRTKKPRYAVRISSASGESDALTHRDSAYVKRIVNAIATAIVEYGR